MIIMGYPGIGKTSIAKDDYRFIDLDSSSMLIRGKYGNKKGWEEAYCNTALMLSLQGYFVFVSTHPKVREKILAKDKSAIVVYPALSLKKEWTDRLYERYNNNRCRQTHNAWVRAKENYDEDIEELMKLRCQQILITNMENYRVKQQIIYLYDSKY